MTFNLMMFHHIYYSVSVMDNITVVVDTKLYNGMDTLGIGSSIPNNYD